MNASKWLISKCEENGWTFSEENGFIRISSGDSYLSWRATWAEDRIMWLEGGGDYHFLQEAIQQWVVYVRDVCQEKGMIGLWVPNSFLLHEKKTDKKRKTHHVNMDDYRLVKRFPRHPESWTNVFTRNVFIPAGQWGIKLARLWGMIVPLLRDIEVMQRASDPMFYLTQNHGPASLSTRMSPNGRFDFGQAVEILYHKGGEYHPLSFHANREGDILVGEEKVPFRSTEEAIEVISMLIEKKERERSLRKLLSTPTRFFDWQVGEVYDLQAFKRTIHAHLSNRYGIDEIEVRMREMDLLRYSHVNKKGEHHLTCFLNTYVVTTVNRQGIAELVYMGEDVDKALDAYPTSPSNISKLKGSIKENQHIMEQKINGLFRKGN